MNGNKCMTFKLNCMRMRRGLALSVAMLVLVLVSLTGGAADGGALGERALPAAALPDDLPTSVVMWVCPDEPFAEGDVTVSGYEAKYDGAALVKHEVAVSGDGFVDGEGASYEYTGSQTSVGTSENTFTYALNDGTQVGNYEITTASVKYGKTAYPLVITIGQEGETGQAFAEIAVVNGAETHVVQLVK